jgi:hypothetical protein
LHRGGAEPHGRAHLGDGGLLTPALPTGRCRAAARNRWRRSGRSPFRVFRRKILTEKGASTVARVWPVGGAAVARAGHRGGWLRAWEATACCRGALGSDSKVNPQPRWPVDGGGGAW